MSMSEWLQRNELETVAGRHVEQPAPVANDRAAVWPLVIMDMASRDQVGRARYGVPLQPHNGRDALRDAYEEVLDQAAYIKTAMIERGESWEMIKSANALVAGKECLGKEDTAKIAGLLQALLRKSHV